MVSARQPRLLSAALATCFVVGSLWFAGSAFIPVARSSPTNTAAVASSAALAASIAAPALAEEEGGFLNFGRIPSVVVSQSTLTSQRQVLSTLPS